MFDISFSELVVIALIALIVLGPEKLPKVARTMGALFHRMQRYISNVKAEIQHEIELDELRKVQNEIKDTAQSVEKNLTQEINSIEQSIHDSGNSPISEQVPKEKKNVSEQDTPLP